jgi:molybdenum cofactor synthesis domain-containing protein
VSTARIVIIGNEVLSGEVPDGNIHFLARRLTELGTRVRSVEVVPDDDDAIVAALRAGLSENGTRILATGGIGPTHDDRTRAAVAAALGVPLERHPEAEECLRAGYGPCITPAELGMAFLPRGSRLVIGRRTGVAGFVAGPVHVFPGVPDLLVDVFETLAPEFAGRPEHRVEILSPLKEGDFAPELTRVAGEFPDVAIGSYPVRIDGRWQVRLILRGADPARVTAAAGHVRRVTKAGEID